MPELVIKDGVMSALVYVQCTRAFECECGTRSTITMNLPEGVTFRGSITVQAQCPGCGGPVVIPHGEHHVEGYRLLTKDA